MSLNINQPRYDLLSQDPATQQASWAVFHLSNALWGELTGAMEFVAADTERASYAARMCYAYGQPLYTAITERVTEVLS